MYAAKVQDTERLWEQYAAEQQEIDAIRSQHSDGAGDEWVKDAIPHIERRDAIKNEIDDQNFWRFINSGIHF